LTEINIYLGQPNMTFVVDGADQACATELHLKD